MMKPADATKTTTSRPAEADSRERGNPELQGEGNYKAARRHRRSLKRFLDEVNVESAAEAAAPKNSEEERDMEAAENAGLSHGRH
jgi:hypothetical protein